MAKYVVRGGSSLRGEVELSGAKNAGFKAMIASLLANSPSEICGLGLISEIDFAKETINFLGGKTETSKDRHCLTIDPQGLARHEIAEALGSKSRSSTMYVGPLLAKFGQAVLPMPGGDKVGARPIDRHLEGLEALGAKIKLENGKFMISAPGGLTGAYYRFKKNTHTGTETLLMAAVLAQGETILDNAAAEPEVDDLITFLNSMGARVMRTGGRTIRISGVKKLHGVRHTVMKDRLEAATLAGMILATRGDAIVLGADPLVLTAFLEKLNEVGARWEKDAIGIRFWWEKPLVATEVTTAVYPGFMTDWQPVWTALMTQAAGTSTVHETVYENRFGHIPDLIKMGGKFEFFRPKVSDPDELYNFNLKDDQPKNLHAVKITGLSELTGTEIEISDIRRGATVILSGLVAHGQTIISDPKDQINRGYEDLVGRLNFLGAKISSV